MVAAPSILGGDLKISDQNNWGGGGGHEQKIKFGGELNFRGWRGGGLMNPNDVMVVVLKDIILC